MTPAFQGFSMSVRELSEAGFQLLPFHRTHPLDWLKELSTACQAG